MTSAQIKLKLHQYIETAEDKKLKAIYTLLQDDIADKFSLTDEQMTELDKRLAYHEAGVGKSFTFAETLENARTIAKVDQSGK